MIKYRCSDHYWVSIIYCLCLKWFGTESELEEGYFLPLNFSLASYAPIGVGGGEGGGRGVPRCPCPYSCRWFFIGPPDVFVTSHITIPVPSPAHQPLRAPLPSLPDPLSPLYVTSKCCLHVSLLINYLLLLLPLFPLQTPPFHNSRTIHIVICYIFCPSLWLYYRI